MFSGLSWWGWLIFGGLILIVVTLFTQQSTTT